MSRRTAEASKAVALAWTNEQQLVREGKGTRDWTLEQQQDILEWGKAYDENGRAFEGHHMKSAEQYPEYQGDAENIQFLSRLEHFDAHDKNFQNPTNGYYDPFTGETADFGLNKYESCKKIDLSNPVSRVSTTLQESNESEKNSSENNADVGGKIEHNAESIIKEIKEDNYRKASKFTASKKSIFSRVSDVVAFVVDKATDIADRYPVRTAVGITMVAVISKEVIDRVAGGDSGGGSSSHEYNGDNYSSDEDLENEDRIEEDDLISDDSLEEIEHKSKRPHITKSYERTRFGKVEHVCGYSTGKNRKDQDDNE